MPASPIPIRAHRTSLSESCARIASTNARRARQELDIPIVLDACEHLRRDVFGSGPAARPATDECVNPTYVTRDMGRPADSRAGYTLLEALRGGGDQTPYFLYAGSRDPTHVRDALSRGAQGATNVGDELLEMLLPALNV